MQEIWRNQYWAAVMSITLLFGAAAPLQANAKSRQASYRSSNRSAAAIHSGMRIAYGRHVYGHGFHIRRYGGGLQCVPFARENSGIELSGNAGTWWNSAEGVYERGAKPEVGSILNFRSTGHMPSGHVAVVTNVLSTRHIEIDHANWSGPGRVSRSIDVVDVSPANDWTEVRVALGNSEDDYGSAYPTYGFIYDRPDTGTMVANAGIQAKDGAIHLQPIAAGTFEDNAAPEEVAEAPDDTGLLTTRRHHGRPAHRVTAHTAMTRRATMATNVAAHRPAPATLRRHRA